MNNYVILKWGTLKGYFLSDSFEEKNKEVVKEFKSIWGEIYNNCCSATGGSKYTHSHKELKVRLVDVLEKLYQLGVTFENGFTDEYYNSFKDIKDYIMNYGGLI